MRRVLDDLAGSRQRRQGDAQRVAFRAQDVQDFDEGWRHGQGIHGPVAGLRVDAVGWLGHGLNPTTGSSVAAPSPAPVPAA